MKKPNLNSLVFSAISLTAALGGVATGADATPAVSGTAGPTVASAPVMPVTGADGSIGLVVTPAALTLERRVIKINLARWLNGARLYMPQPSGGFKYQVYDDYVLEQQNATAGSPSPLGSLIDDDATAQVPLKLGQTSVVVDIGLTRTIERFGFFSFSAAGAVDVYYSNNQPTSSDPTSSSWQSANIHQNFAAKRIVNIDLKALEARFVMVVFRAATPGNIGPMALFGSIQIKGPINAPEQYDKAGKKKVVPPEDLVEFDYAQEAYGSKVSDVVGGDPNDAQNVLNSDPNKSLTLGALQQEATAKDPGVKMENIFVVDMGEKHDINKVGLLYQTNGDGKFDFYFLNTLPTKPKEVPTAFNEYLQRPKPLLLAANDNRFALAALLAQQDAGAPSGATAPVDYLPPTFFTDNKPGFSQSVTGSDDNGRINGVFENAQSFRYALIRWTPATPNQPVVDVFRVNLIGKVPLEDIGLRRACSRPPLRRQTARRPRQAIRPRIRRRRRRRTPRRR
jgi:hypothetical protein